MKKVLLCVSIPFLFPVVQAQIPNDHGIFTEYKPGFYQNYILKGIEDFERPAAPAKARTWFGVDLSGRSLLCEAKQYTSVWHQPAVSQGNTGTCWSFGATGLIESEIFRLSQKKIDLSEMHTVYWEYVERAAVFVRTRGATYFAEGSESNAIVRIYEKYGCMPYSAYSGMLPGQTVHNHENMEAEMEAYLNKVKADAAWDEQTVTSTIKIILNRYMGSPPERFTLDGKSFTPREFLAWCGIQPRDYFSFMSTLSATFNQKGELVEADNWWHSQDYYNVRLDDFMLVVRNAIKNGYSMCLCGDVSEAGFDRQTHCGIIPTFDIPPAYIDDNARQMRLSNASTTDDHCMQLVGYTEKDGGYWYLLKDSGAGAFDGTERGYRFVSEDYIRLKMMNVLVHKYGGKPVLDKIIK